MLPIESKRLYPTADGSVIQPASLRLARIKDVAATYGMTENYVRRLVEGRAVATVKVGKYRLIDLDSWEQLIVSGYTPARADA